MSKMLPPFPVALPVTGCADGRATRLAWYIYDQRLWCDLRRNDPESLVVMRFEWAAEAGMRDLVALLSGQITRMSDVHHASIDVELDGGSKFVLVLRRVPWGRAARVFRLSWGALREMRAEAKAVLDGYFGDHLPASCDAGRSTLTRWPDPWIRGV